ncbi:hypothetical protein HMI56_005383, partial [Coelomomyces lativittatus]
MYAIETLLLFKTEWTASDIQLALSLCLSKHPPDTTLALSLLTEYVETPRSTEADKQSAMTFYQTSSLQGKWNDMYTRYALTRLSVLDVQRLRELDVAMMRLAVQYHQHTLAWRIYEQSTSYSIYMCRVAMFVCKDILQTIQSELHSTSSTTMKVSSLIQVWQARAAA